MILPIILLTVFPNLAFSANEIVIHVENGDLTTHFVISAEKSGALATMDSSAYGKSNTHINERNFQYLKSRIAEIGKTAPKSERCSRDQATFTLANAQEIKACLLSNTAQSKQVRSLLKVLVEAFP